MAYYLDPCKACWNNSIRENNININNLNNCFTETAAAYSAFPSNTSMNNQLQEQWKECMQKRMSSMSGPNSAYYGGRDFCDFQLNPAPVFVQYPHYFPGLWRGYMEQNPHDYNNKNKALMHCYQLCNTTSSPHECHSNCLVDHDALVLREYN